MIAEEGDFDREPNGSSPEQDPERALIVLRKNCVDLREVIPAARKLIGRSTAIRERGYSVAQITLEAVLVREDDSRQ